MRSRNCQLVRVVFLSGVPTPREEQKLRGGVVGLLWVVGMIAVGGEGGVEVFFQIFESDILCIGVGIAAVLLALRM
jgi:hypothetical protein